MTNTYAFNLILSGDFGSGKTVTMLSFIPPGKKYGDPIRRLIFDQELRCGIYNGEKDDPTKLIFKFDTVQVKGRVTGDLIYLLMEKTHTGAWKDGIIPDMIGIDDIAMFQDTYFAWMKDKNNAVKAAKLYGMDGNMTFTSKSWQPWSPSAISIFKNILGEWLVDLKAHGIFFISNTPPRHVWDKFGSKALAADGKPEMRILGNSAKMLDVFQKHADAIWNLSCTTKDEDGKIKLKSLPTITMDLFTPKASMPGVPEQFEWPGWQTIWKWNTERTYVADITKIIGTQIAFDQETIDEHIKKAKWKMYNELKPLGVTIEHLTEFFNKPIAPTIDMEFVTNKETYELIKAWVVEQFNEKNKNNNPAESTDMPQV